MIRVNYQMEQIKNSSTNFNIHKNIPIFYVDAENVKDKWVTKLKNEIGKVFVFYTKNVQQLTFNEVNVVVKNYDIEFIECGTGKNGLDFQLSSYIGYMVGKYNLTNHIIVSNDKGFDVLIDFWNRRGTKVQRMEL